jgi:hypothetical protein
MDKVNKVWCVRMPKRVAVIAVQLFGDKQRRNVWQ